MPTVHITMTSGVEMATYDPVANEENIRGLSLAMRDTTMLYKYSEKTIPGTDMGWRAWRLRVTEPGVWMIHCHILQHMVMGKFFLGYHAPGLWPFR